MASRQLKGLESRLSKGEVALLSLKQRRVHFNFANRPKVISFFSHKLLKRLGDGGQTLAGVWNSTLLILSDYLKFISIVKEPNLKR